MRNKQYLDDMYGHFLDDDPTMTRLIASLDALSTVDTPPGRVIDGIGRSLHAHAQARKIGTAPRRRFAPARWLPRIKTVTMEKQLQPRPHRERRPPSKVGGLVGLTTFLIIVGVITLGLATSLSRTQLAPQPGTGGVALEAAETSATPQPAPTQGLRPGGASLSSLPASIRDISTHVDLGTERIFKESLGTSFDLARQTEGYTLTLKLAYADANQVVICYTFEGPADQISSSRGHSVGVYSSLTDAQGNEVWAYGDNTSRVIEGSVGIIQRFNLGDGEDSLRVVANPGSGKLNLRLKSQIQRFPVNPQTHVVNPVAIGEPLRFEFSVPVQPARILEPNQTVEAGGAAATLERVVISPTQTRVYLKGVGEYVLTHLSTDGGRSYIKTTWSGQWHLGGTGAAVDIFTAPWLMDEHGEWELIVEKVDESAEDPKLLDPTPAPYKPVNADPWIFRFNVP